MCIRKLNDSIQEDPQPNLDNGLQSQPNVSEFLKNRSSVLKFQILLLRQVAKNLLDD